MRVLITGATGNVGYEVIRYIKLHNTTNQIVVGARNIDKAHKQFQQIPDLEFVKFDFEDQTTFAESLKGIDRVFLLRPPHISDIEKYFRPLLENMKTIGIQDIVFLSVQGAEKSKVIPHNKIEKLIKELGFNYIFLRPSYFMQNLTSTLLEDIRTKRQIILPAGSAKFNWVDIENIAEVAAILLEKFSAYKNQAYELTGYENENFSQVVRTMNEVLDSPIEYVNINPFKFFRLKTKEGMKRAMIIVMIMLHLLPRFQKPPLISDFYERITGKNPTDLKDFIMRERNKLKSKQ